MCTLLFTVSRTAQPALFPAVCRMSLQRHDLVTITKAPLECPLPNRSVASRGGSHSTQRMFVAGMP